jgi:hypothetical protein
MSVETIKNFLPDEEFNNLISVLDENFPWYLGNTIDDFDEYNKTPLKGYKASKKTKQLRHLFIHPERGENSSYASLIYPIVFRLGGSKVLKAKLNLNFNSGEQIVGGWHNDVPIETNSKVAILYLNTNNGYTLLEDNTKIKSEANKLAKFDNIMMHTCVSQTDTNERYVLNIVYV